MKLYSRDYKYKYNTKEAWNIFECWFGGRKILGTTKKGRLSKNNHLSILIMYDLTRQYCSNWIKSFLKIALCDVQTTISKGSEFHADSCRYIVSFNFLARNIVIIFILSNMITNFICTDDEQRSAITLLKQVLENLLILSAINMIPALICNQYDTWSYLQSIWYLILPAINMIHKLKVLLWV